MRSCVRSCPVSRDWRHLTRSPQVKAPKGKAEKAPKGEKKPLSGYMLFCKFNREAAKKKVTRPFDCCAPVSRSGCPLPTHTRCVSIRFRRVSNQKRLCLLSPRCWVRCGRMSRTRTRKFGRLGSSHDPLNLSWPVAWCCSLSKREGGSVRGGARKKSDAVASSIWLGKL